MQRPQPASHILNEIAVRNQRLKPPHAKVHGLALLCKRALLGLLAGVSCLHLGCGALAQTKTQPLAAGGVLDLSAWDFARDGAVALSGEYEFYWQRLLTSENFSASAAPRPEGFIQVPGAWNGYELKGKTLGGEGYATYRLRVRLKEPAPLAFKFLDVATACDVYANGALIYSAGTLSDTRATTAPRYFPAVAGFAPGSDEIELILHLANFHHRKGGPWEPIRLGLSQDLQEERERTLQLDVLLFGCIVIMGLYHLGLFAVRTNERAPLYFGIFCLLIAVRHVVIGERLVLQFFPQMNWELLGKIEYLAYYLAPPTGAMLLFALYPKDFYKPVLRIILIGSAGLSLFVLATPVRLFSHTVAAHHVYTIVCSLYGVFVILLAARRGREGALLHLLGFSLLSLAIVSDILNYFALVHTPLVLPFGLLAFILAQAVVLALRFSNAFRTIAWQRVELEKALRQYERELIEKRRVELQYRALYNDNPTMYFTVDERGVVLSVNQFGLQYLGYKAEELVGQPVLKVFYEEDQALVPHQLALCLQEPQRVHEWELRKQRKDRSVLWVKESARCVQNPAGQTVVLIVCEDITPRKQAEAEAAASRERLRALSAHLQSLSEKEGESVSEARPAVLDKLGLVPALQWQLEEFQKRTRLACEFQAEDQELNLAGDRELAVFRIFQESLANIKLHAQARSVSVNVARREQNVWVEIRDDGLGITEEALNSEGKFGLLSVRERALIFGGEVEITNAASRGTTITIKMPAA